ncbi:MAG: WD40 repeat protein [Myxococcota bacterium]|jgi:WD40 repeat protein
MSSTGTAKRGRGGKVTLKGHRGKVWAVATSPDGTSIASVDSHGSLRISALWSAEPAQLIPAHTGYATACAWRDDRTVVTCGIHEARAWDVDTGEQTTMLAFKKGRAIASLSCSPDGRFAAMSGQSESGLLWDLERGSKRSLPANHNSQLTFSADGTVVMGTRLKMIVGRSPGGTVKWSLETVGCVHAVAVSADGLTLAAGVWDSSQDCGYSVCIYHIPDGTLLHTHTGPSCAIQHLAFSPDGAWLVVGPISNMLTVLSTADWSCTDRLGKVTVAMGLAIADDTLAVAESMTNKVRLWDLRRFLGT